MFPKTDLWQYLASPTRRDKPILLYGMGNGGDQGPRHLRDAENSYHRLLRQR